MVDPSDWAKRHYVRGRVESMGIVLEEPPGGLPDGTRFEGYASAEPPTPPPLSPLNSAEGERLLGEEIVRAARRRGIDFAELDWSERGTTGWYKTIPWTSPKEPCGVWLPLFAQALRLIERHDDRIDRVLSDAAIVVSSRMKIDNVQGPPSLDHIDLTGLIVSRVQSAVWDSAFFSLPTWIESLMELNAMSAACVRARERLTAGA